MNSLHGQGYGSHRRKPRSIELAGDRSPRIKLMKYDEVVMQPVIEVTPQALADMYTLLDLADGEVGWLGNVTTPEAGVYRIDEIFIPWQDCHATTAIFPTEGQQKLIMDLMEQGRNLKEVNLKFWGHSHVWMPCNPSGQDDLQMAEFEKFKVDYMIRGILNKRREYRFWIWDYKNGFVYEDVPVTIAVIPTDERRDELEAIYQDRVQEIRPQPRSWFGGNSNTQDKQPIVSEPVVTQNSKEESASTDETQPTVPVAVDKPIDDAEVPPREEPKVMLTGKDAARIKPTPEKEKAEAKGNASVTDGTSDEETPKKKGWFSWLFGK